MGKLDLNSPEFDTSKKIFNNGAAGVVHDLEVKVKIKKEGDHPQAPDYSIVFVDPNGGEVDQGIYYHSDTGDKDIDEKRLVGLGGTLQHVWGAVIGKETSIPEYDTINEAVDGVMGLVAENLTANPDKKFSTVVTYGNKDYPKKYLNVKRFPPFMEGSRLAANLSRLYMGPNDMKVPFAEDAKDTDYSGVHTDEEADPNWGTDG